MKDFIEAIIGFMVAFAPALIIWYFNFKV